jgi:lipoyl-dependent peroxiredoxin
LNTRGHSRRVFLPRSTTEEIVPIEKVLYVAHAMAIGGRDGRAVSSNGVLDVRLARPPELGGSGRPGTNPEQLFAAGYAACFIDAIKFVAARDGMVLLGDVTIDAMIALGAMPTGFCMQATLKISVPGVPRPEAKFLVEKADHVCPYSNAIRGNVDVRLIVL